MLIITAHLIVYVGYNITKQQQIDLLVNKYMKTLHQIEKELFNLPKKPFPPLQKQNEFMFPLPPPPIHKKINPEDFEKKLNTYDMSLSKIEIQTLEKEATLLAKELEWKLFEYKGYNYFLRITPFSTLLIKDNTKLEKKTQDIIFLTVLFNILFISFYIFLIRKLKPLLFLKRDIQKFSKGNLDIDTSCKGKDEISEVSNEFNKAITQIRTLTQSRNLFLRNIMHELKTPIIKGLLIANMINEDESKKDLEKLFYRLEYLINEFAKIERFTSNNISLEKREYSFADILDQALDILLIDSSEIDINIKTNPKLYVDFEMFSLVIKNLIDNALKHGTSKPLVEVNEKSISISNEGKALEKTLENYNQPFNRKYESSQKGLGLGLYIIKNILDLHDLKLEYTYKDNKNIFTINY